MSQISTKEQIIKFKDYADIADASYSLFILCIWKRKKWLDNNIDKNNLN